MADNRSDSNNLKYYRHDGIHPAREKPPNKGKPLARGKPKPRARTPGSFRENICLRNYFEGRKTMKKLKMNFQKIAAVIIAFVMCVSVFSGVVAAKAAGDASTIDINKKGSITVTKYASTNANAQTGDATGTEKDADTIKIDTYTTLAGATFKLFKIANADKVMSYYDGADETAYDVKKFTYDGTTAKYDGTDIAAEDIYEQNTGEDGTCTFRSLPVGIYVLREISAPSQVSAPLAEDSLISIPMVNTDTSDNGGTDWMYDINVYPKNHESTGNVKLTKIDQNSTPLQNVVFKLYKKELTKNGGFQDSDWAEVTSTVNNEGQTVALSLVTNENGILELKSLPAGLYGTQYKLVEVYENGTSPEGYIINSNPLYFVVKDNTVTWNGTNDANGCININTGVVETPVVTTEDPTTLPITLENEVPSLAKMVQENGGSSWKNDEQYRLDDTITYKITAYVPSNVAELGIFEITDTPDKGIDDIAVSSVKYGVTADACTTELATDGYTYTPVSAADENGTGFKFTINDKANVAGKYIEICYIVKMNANAVIAGKGNGNTATLTYSKYIGNASTDTYTITDEARVYTYQYEITKRLDSSSGKVAPDVEFNLLYSENGDAVNVVKLADGEYRLALGSDQNTTTTLVTNIYGKILIKGLENGKYYLKETKTVEKYNLLSKPVEIEVNVTETTTWTDEKAFTDVTKSMKTFTSVEYNVAEAKNTSTIVNKKGFTLPKTGSMGFILFCVLGLALIAGGAWMIFGGKRAKKIR